MAFQHSVYFWCQLFVLFCCFCLTFLCEVTPNVAYMLLSNIRLICVCFIASLMWIGGHVSVASQKAGHCLATWPFLEMFIEVIKLNSSSEMLLLMSLSFQNYYLGVLTVHLLVSVVFEWVIPVLFFPPQKNGLNNFCHAFIFNKYKRWNTWLWSGIALHRNVPWHKTFSSRQSFLSSCLQHQAVR